MSNPSKTFEFIRLYPRLTSDPVSGKVGEIYFNVTLNRLRVCTSGVPVWEDLSVSEIEAAQNLNAQLIEGGTWSVNLAGTILTLSADAYIQLPGQDKTINKILAQSIPAISNGDSIYFTINRSGVGPITISPTVAPTASIPLNKNTFIIATKVNGQIYVGETLLLPGESKTLGGMSNQILAVLGASSEADSSGQAMLKIESTTLVRVTPVNKTALDGQDFGMSFGGKDLNFSGAVIDFSTGTVYKEDGITALGDNFTSPSSVIAVGSYRWYSVTIVKNTVNGLNQNTGKLTITEAAVDGASPAAAEKANYPSGINSGSVCLFNNGGVIEVVDSVQNVSAGGGGTGGGSGLIKVRLNDPIATSLPSGPTYTCDGQSAVNGDLILFQNVSPNPGVYLISGVGISIAFTLQSVFNDLPTPTAGDQIFIAEGDLFGNQVGTYNGTNFLFNDIVRYFDGTSTNFWEQTSIKEFPILDNTTAPVFSVNVAGSENFIVSYSVIRGSGKESGQLIVSALGANANVAQYDSVVSPTGVSFDTTISLGVLTLNYVSDNSGSSGTMKYFVSRWSDSAGGPSTIPNYSSSPSLGGFAGGNPNEVQYNGPGGLLAGDPRFIWDGTKSAINLNGLEIKTASASITLLDNQIDTVLLTYNASDYTNLIIEYGLFRDTDMETGRLLIANTSTKSAINTDAVDTSAGPGLGITFNIYNVGATIEVRYTTTNTGFNATMKYNIRQWLI